jgi:hypothetical protein
VACFSRDRQIDLEQTRAPADFGAGVAPGVGRGHGEGRRIDPFADSLASGRSERYTGTQFGCWFVFLPSAMTVVARETL